MHPCPEYDSERVYISLGSNAGDSETILLSALELINAEFSLIAVSNLYRTTAQIMRNQADFLNCAACFSFHHDKTIPPMRMLQKLHRIENSHGRNRSHEQKNGPRTLDIDIIFLGRRNIDTHYLRIPHPSYISRRFVLVPLLDIDPNLRDPITKKPLAEHARILEQDADQGIYLIKSDRYNAFISELRKND